MLEERRADLELRGKITRAPPDPKSAKEIVLSAETNAAVVLEISLTERSATVVFREIYESMRELGDALWKLLGYEARSHDASMELLSAEFDCAARERLDIFRRLRHSANYQGYRITAAQASEIAAFWKTCGAEILARLKRKVS